MSTEKKWHKAVKKELNIALNMVNQHCEIDKYGVAKVYLSTVSKCLDQLSNNKPDLYWLESQAKAYHDCMLDENGTLQYHAENYVSMANAVKEIQEEQSNESK